MSVGSTVARPATAALATVLPTVTFSCFLPIVLTLCGSMI